MAKDEAWTPSVAHLLPCKVCGNGKADFRYVPTLPFRYDGPPYCILCYLVLYKARNQEEFDEWLPNMRDLRKAERVARAKGDDDPSTRSEAEGARWDE